MKRFSAFLLLASTLLGTACSDDATAIGGSVMPDEDHVSTDQYTFKVTTQSRKTGAMLANTNECYLGSVIDPETQAMTTSSFLAQFHMPEGFSLPAKSELITDANGKVVADSCVLRILHAKYYGDSLATMKLYVQELDTAKTLSEKSSYYTDIDPTQFLSTTTAQRKTITYTALDQTKSASVLNNKKLYRDISGWLSTDFGSGILNKYYENANFFKNSYEFAKHVCAGFYFKHAGGVGTMIDSELTTLDFYYRQHSKTTAGKDTLLNKVLRLGATGEVIQSTHVDNELPTEMLSDTHPYTYLKSPSGIHTEATLPVSDIVAGTHYNDTINSAKLLFRTLAAQQNVTYPLKHPDLILLLPSDSVDHFFRHTALPNNITSYVANYNAKGYYAFDNIAPLISRLRQVRDLQSGVTATDDEAARRAKWSTWESAHPNWNKVVILPVTGDYLTQQDVYTRRTNKILQRVRNNFGLTSVRIEGGTRPVEMSVIYSRFKQ